MRILVTGANGFVGKVVCRRLREAGHNVVAAIRQPSADLARECDIALVGDIQSDTQWSRALENVSGVVHLAALTHREHGLDDLDAYRKINVEGTHGLAHAAKKADIDTFVFVSSIKVNGEFSPLDARGLPVRLSGLDTPRPTSLYGRSKWEAEERLHKVLQGSSTSLVILRPPLIYGSGQKGNLLSLMRAVDRGVPLPLAGFKNTRSLISVDNLASAIVNAFGDRVSRSGTYTLADIDISSAELVRAMAVALARRPRLFSVPLSVLDWFGRAIGRHDSIKKITGNLVVDSRKFSEDFDWVARKAFEESLAETVESYRSNQPR